MKKFMFLALALALSISAGAEDVTVRRFRLAGPFPVMKPYIVDELDVNSRPFETGSLLDSPLSSDALENATLVSGDALPTCDGSYSLGLAAFALESSGYAEADLKVEGPENYKAFVDGQPCSGRLKLEPGTHEVRIKYLAAPGAAQKLNVTISTEKEGRLSIREDGRHLYGMKDVLLGKRYSDVSVSADGKYMAVSVTTTYEGGSTSTSTRIMETASGRVVATLQDRVGWMPSGSRCHFTRRTPQGNSLVSLDPATGAEEVIVGDLPRGSFHFTPDGNSLLFSLTQQGPKEREGVYQILSPDDRQPGWRNRSYAALYDIRSGVMQQLTFGHNNSYISDVSKDGSKALLMVSRERLEQRPTTVSSLYLLDLKTLEAKSLVTDDGFMGSARFSPDASSVLLSGSPEAFGRIGMNVKEGQTPSLTDQQLYIMDLASGSIRPVTKNFDPCVQNAVWSSYDGQIYFTAENRDLYSLYRMNPKNGRISQIETSEELVNRFSLAEDAPVLAYYGQGAMNSDRLYLCDLKSGRTTLVEDLSEEKLRNVELGECHEWNFRNSKGETVCGRYYLPPHFDPSKKYPMIVNYYGGCSPTSRNFESRYPHHAYAALGYVVYVVAGPSGATGFGQEWSARHVNTAGEGPAQDIIEGAMQFCKEHPFVNEKKVGCIGASYGGFMSQYIPTITDFFACSVSHAGISDHTSYWGFGYWGYSYSETSMANSYPWTRKDLFVDQSPLYRADKINTPILFVHGDADTNVPVNESIQMFTALKLLGKETAFVAVKNQDHHILEYQKRLDWQNTIWAWFAKYLQDDPDWWDAIYAPKSL